MVGSVGSSGGFDLTKMMQMQKKMFAAMDSDGDGTVSKGEMTSFIQNLESGDSQSSSSSSTSSSTDVSSLVDSIFNNADSDGNGLLSLQESEANLAKVAQQMQSQSSTGGAQGPDGGKRSQMKENFDAIGSALDSGNLDDAQAAFQKLQENAPSNGNQPQEITDLSNALSSGDLDAAKEAYSQIKEKMAQGPHGAPPDGGSGQTQSTSKENELFKSLISMMSSDQSSDSSSSSSDSSSSTSSTSASGLKDLLASAVQNYMQWSNAYAQSSNSTLLSSSLYG
ncbi:EF-hand domain-containing protein [Geomesophilobacter sediminis]|uniref:EF-hand domain-containing protein n=1 Tax=Geomesophilobacter sediminis TaxID=2798584 RepID=A0A8J7LZ98_9BACT|nr:EF-hand domain-containing protein [Geomesophilobacter sediminis]MBJ6726442.1 EF-hand domain-containing protein [Geomesophilobacter sediminis]